MDAHTAVERKLKADIISKNQIRKDVEKRLTAIRRWQDALSAKKNEQKRARIKRSIARYQADVDRMKEELLRSGEELEKRIKAEMAYSEEEIKDFENRLDKDLKAMEKAKKALEEEGKKEEGPKDESKAESIPNLKKRLSEDLKKIAADEKELKSEERDKILFTIELKRIAMERKLFRS